MATTIDVPQLGNTVEECLVTRWFKRKGDPVAAGEVVAEIETDKTTFEITSPVDGQVLEIYVEEGAAVPVFSRLLVVGTDGEASTHVDAPGSHLSHLTHPSHRSHASAPGAPRRDPAHLSHLVPRAPERAASRASEGWT